jgi:hypothetical protein
MWYVEWLAVFALFSFATVESWRICTYNHAIKTLLTSFSGGLDLCDRSMPGLPDFSLYNTYTKTSKNIPNYHWKVLNIPNGSNISQLAIKCTNTVLFEALRNLSKLQYLVWKYTIWQPCSVSEDYIIFLKRPSTCHLMKSRHFCPTSLGTHQETSNFPDPSHQLLPTSA